MSTDTAIARLAKLDTCAVSDALDRLGLRGAVVGIRPLWPGPRIVGRAVTVKIKPAGLEKPKQHLCTPAIDAATDTSVIVVDHSGRTDVAAWGGLLSLAARIKNIRGVIVDGAARDVDESRDLGFPVFGKAPVQITARGRVMQESFNEEIECAGVQVRPGELVIADMSGVVFIPREKEEEVLTQAEALAAAEQRMAEAIKTGRSVVEVMETLGYEAMLSKDK